ncbi:MAG: RNA polymerase sigma factor [Myxococcota bacterium]
MRGDQALTAEGFARKFRECAPMLWCVAAAIVGDRARAEDVLQEAAMIALGKLDAFEVGTSVQAWLAQIVRYVALNHRRREQRRREQRRREQRHLDQRRKEPQHRQPRHLDQWPGIPATRDQARGSEHEPRLSLVGEDPEPVGVSPRGELVPGQRHFDDTVVAALDQLGDTARACLLLRTVMDLDYREIGEILGIPEGTAMSHVHRARTRMRRTLGAARAEGSTRREVVR